MTTPYYRTEAQKQYDVRAAREFEQRVRSSLPDHTRDESDAADRLDFWVPGCYVEVKEKRQPLTARWTKFWPTLDERDLFVMDELTVRRALRHWPDVYFVLRDVPNERLFVASITDLVCVERVRVNRVGKGKWLLNLQSFRRLASLDDLFQFVMNDLLSTPWKRSECLSALEVPQV